MKIKILSWNIWIDGDFKEISDLLLKEKADIIGLQEVKNDDPDRKVIEFLQSLGYEYVFAPVKKTWGDEVYNDGPAVFSKYPIIQKKTYKLSEEDSRAAAQADIKINNRILHVLSTHLVHTHQKPSKIQEEQAEHLIKLVPEKNSILMGDFNALPDSNAVTKVTQTLNDTDQNLLPTWSVYPEGCEMCEPKEILYKLDYIFTTNDLQTTDYKVENSNASDHLPISVIIEL